MTCIQEYSRALDPGDPSLVMNTSPLTDPNLNGGLAMMVIVLVFPEHSQVLTELFIVTHVVDAITI